MATSSTILITGADGFIGSHLCRKFLHDGHSVLCLDDLSTGNYDNIAELIPDPNFEFVEHDLTKPFFPDRIDGIYNLKTNEDFIVIFIEIFDWRQNPFQ